MCPCVRVSRVCPGNLGLLTTAPRRLTACVIAGCVGHASVHCDSGPVLGGPESARVVCFTAAALAGCVGHASVHCDSGPRAWGPGERARCVFHSSSSTARTLRKTWMRDHFLSWFCTEADACVWRACPRQATALNVNAREPTQCPHAGDRCRASHRALPARPPSTQVTTRHQTREPRDHAAPSARRISTRRRLAGGARQT